MKTRYIYGLLAGILIAMSATSCSDNYDTGFEPVQKTLILKVDGQESAFSRNYNAAPGNYDVNVESNTLWRVEANSTGGWISVDKVSGRGNESFTFSLRDNMLDKERSGTVTVYMVDREGEPLNTAGSSIALTVTQDFSNVMLSPSSLQPFKPVENERILFTITANVPWTLDVSYEGDATGYISIAPESGDMQSADNGAFSGDGEATFYMSVADNRTSSDRKAYLNLKSETGSYSVEISQTKSEYNFDVSPSETQTVGPKGGSITFGVLSLVGWSVSTSVDWISFTVPSYDKGSDDRIETVASIAANDEGSERSAILHFTPQDSRYPKLDVTVVQRGWDYTFDVTPRENRVVAAEGATIDFKILSMVGWNIDSSEDWISFSVSSSDRGSDDFVETKATVEPNSEGVERTAVVRFIPADNRFEEIIVNVAQRGYDVSFEISAADGMGVVSEEGETIALELDSRFRWTASSPSWLSVNPDHGNASASTSRIEVTAAVNRTNDNRTGTVTITPQPTDFAGGVRLDPAALGVQPLHIGVTQFGGREAAVSVPWLRDDYTDRTATVEFNFYSPFNEVVEAGLEWGRADSDDRQTLTVTPTDPTSCTVSFELTGLNAATRYVARGYVIDSRGTRKDGNWSYPFSTAGQYPGPNDNPTPSR